MRQDPNETVQAKTPRVVSLSPHQTHVNAEDFQVGGCTKDARPRTREHAPAASAVRQAQFLL